MTLYTRHQLLLVLLLVGAAGAGLAIDHWRRASPDLVERLERLDRAERTAAPETAAREARPPVRDARRGLGDGHARERSARGAGAPRRGGPPGGAPPPPAAPRGDTAGAARRQPRERAGARALARHRAHARR